MGELQLLEARRNIFISNTAARTVIEMCTCLLKARWAILRTACYYPVRAHNRMISACSLLHNLVRNEMSYDPLEEDLPEYITNDENVQNNLDVIDSVETSNEWTNWRRQLAEDMYNEWRAARGRGHNV